MNAAGDAGPKLAAAIDLGNGAREEAVAVTAGERLLRGNLIVGPRRELAILFVHGWGGNRAGPHNLLTQAARDLAKIGLSSLRFDLPGRGESDGDRSTVGLDEMADDTLAAAEFLHRRLRPQRLLLAGICSGGNIAIGVLDRLPDVAGMFLISVYPFSNGDSFGRSARRTAHYVRDYWRKLRTRRTWAKLFRGAVDFRQIFRILFAHFVVRKRSAVTMEDGQRAFSDPRRNLITHPVPVRMIYGDADPDFRASYDYYANFAARHRLTVSISVYEGANHNFYSVPWTKRLLAELRGFAGGLTCDVS